MGEIGILEQRRLARTAKHLVDVRLVGLHPQAVKALLDPVAGARIRQRALQQVEKWERDNLCNPRYIKAWRGILALPVASMQAAILNDDPDSLCLRQNSPFGFFVDQAT